MMTFVALVIEMEHFSTDDEDELYCGNGVGGELSGTHENGF